MEKFYYWIEERKLVFGDILDVKVGQVLYKILFSEKFVTTTGYISISAYKVHASIHMISYNFQTFRPNFTIYLKNVSKIKYLIIFCNIILPYSNSLYLKIAIEKPYTITSFL